jgi:alpha-L-fucosidase
MFTAEHFDADDWAKLFKASGARFAGPVAEHHDGFSMWDSKVNKWNAARMGPKRNVVGELATAIRKQDMRFMVAMHHAEQHWFYNHDNRYDTTDPEYAGLYGKPHDIGSDAVTANDWLRQERPDKEFLDQWRAKLDEVVDGYQPDFIWFDDGIRFVQEHYKREFLAYYYNQAEAWGKEVLVSYKDHDFVPGTGLADLEQGRFNDLSSRDASTT